LKEFNQNWVWDRPSNGFYPLKDDVVEDAHGGEGLKIMAMGDVNNDKHIDLVTANN
jgi:hypothetical protein